MPTEDLNLTAAAENVADVTVDTTDSAVVVDAGNQNTENENTAQTPQSEKSVIDRLTDFYAAQEDSGDEIIKTTDSEDGETLPDDEQTDDSTDADADDSRPAVEDAEEDVIEAADFDSLTTDEAGAETSETDTETTDEVYPDIEALRLKHPRQSKAFYEEAAKYSEEAQKGRELLTRLGGEEFVVPLAEISAAITAGDTARVLVNISEMASEEQAVKFVADSMFVGLVQSKELQSNPETADFGKALETYANVILEKRFGNAMTVEKIDSLSALDKNGWLDFLERSRAQGFIDSDEWFQMLDGDKQPEQFASLKEENKKLAFELEEKKAQVDQKTVAQDKETETKFYTATDAQIESVFSRVVLAKSVLRDLTSDSSETKAEKARLRAPIIREAKTAFKTNPSIKQLLGSYKAGDVDSDTYRKQLSAAVNDAVLQTREETGIAERIAAKIYGQTRNGSLKKIAPAAKTSSDVPAVTANGQSGKAPTETTAFQSNRPKTVDEITSNLEKAFLQFGG
ncbi:MAG TPA: hypothetical protein VNI84_18970 [Pyrinomonadaceae bacterium]|nr:hypothetical protein [Pyrinomonadaceae bacterium]